MTSPCHIALDEQLEHALAYQLARHAQGWAQRIGADEEAQRALVRCVTTLGLAMEAGHVCLPLTKLEKGAALADLRAQLERSGVVCRPGEMAKPFVLDDEGRFYLHRHYDEERRLAQRLLALLKDEHVVPESEDDQQRAIEHALRQRLTLISGGPGTGKTTIVARLLAKLLDQQLELRIALAAPTGKAAQRMLEALRARFAALPNEAGRLFCGTLHRLLGWQPDEDRFRHGLENPLPYDLIIVDEASMIDLALAVQLFTAVPEHARLILLGDRDQLAAVEKGAIFAELARPSGLVALEQAVVLLRRNYRFAADSGLGQLAQAVRKGDRTAVLALLTAGLDDVCWIEDGAPTLSAARIDALAEGYADYVAKVSAIGTPSAAHEALSGYRVLAALRDGPRGVAGLNDELEKRLRQRLKASPWATWYAGRAVIVLANDYTLELYNGDIGIALPDEAGELRVYFPHGDSWRAIAPLRLPPHASAWAMTVHKAQGSEFRQVACILPAAASPILSRELLYTAITRATQRVCLIGKSERIVEAVTQPTQRIGGLLARCREM